MVASLLFECLTDQPAGVAPNPSAPRASRPQCVKTDPLPTCALQALPPCACAHDQMDHLTGMNYLLKMIQLQQFIYSYHFYSNPA
jgi:hypothetical protein